MDLIRYHSIIFQYSDRYMFVLFFWQLTVKLVLNLRQEEVEFYNTIVTPTYVILRRGEGVDVMEVDKDNLEKATAEASFVEQAGVFDKAPDTESPPLADRTIPQEQIHIFQTPHLISWCQM